MAFPIAAILNKAAIAVGSNKKVLKTVGCIALGLVVIICMPIAAVLGIFSGGAGIDTGKTEIPQEEILQAEETMERIEEKMLEKGFGEERIEEAMVLFSFCLFQFAEEENFAERLAGCFEAEQTDEELITAVNAEFGTNILPEEFRDLVNENQKEEEKNEENYDHDFV